MAVKILRELGVAATFPLHESKVILGVDPSTSTGVVVLAGSKFIQGHLLKFDGVEGYQRLHLIAEAFGSILDIYKPDEVFIEGFGYNNRFTLVILVQIGTLIRQQMWNRGMKWWDVPPNVLKKWVTGSGKADKKAMAKSVKERWGFEAKSNDVMDAYALAQLGRYALGSGLDSTLKGVRKE
jgi:crossover junction endodeoxyribonuclease RuvC